MRPFRTVRRLAAAVAACAVVLVAGCTTPPTASFPDLTYTYLPPITLNVAKIEIVDKFQPDKDATHIESRLPVSPEQALRNWARDRLRANGVTGVAKFVIEDASVTETDLKKTQGLKGMFTTDQAQRYDAKVRATIHLEGVPRVSRAYAEAEATRSQTVAEDATINDREQVWFDLTDRLMKDFNPVMEKSIKEHLGDFVR